MDPLTDPLKDRRVKGVKPPPHRPLADKLMWKENKGKYPAIAVTFFETRK